MSLQKNALEDEKVNWFNLRLERRREQVTPVSRTSGHPDRAANLHPVLV